MRPAYRYPPPAPFPSLAQLRRLIACEDLGIFRAEQAAIAAATEAAAAARRDLDARVAEGLALGLDRAGIRGRTDLGLFQIALAERRIAGVTG
jgi:hypothetical protein